MLTRLKIFGPYVLAAAAGGAFALYPLGKNKTESALSLNAPHSDASLVTSTPSFTSAPSKTKSTGRIETQNDRPDSSSICDNECQDDISESLVTDSLLSEDMIARILENPAGFAQNLSHAPEIVSRLFATLKADEEKDNGTQNAALVLLEALSNPEKFALAQVLTSNARDQDRIVGLELLELSLETEKGSIQTLNKVLANEGSPSVLSKAINIASNLPKETGSQGTLDALTKIIRFNASDHFSGPALLAKVNIAPNANTVYEDISASLANISNDENAFGLTALQMALQRDGVGFGAEGRWYDDLSLRESVLAIAQNKDLSEDTRSQANKLLNSYFSDD